MPKCAQCAELERQLKDAWAQILRMDTELKKLSELVAQIEAVQAPEYLA